MWILGLEKIALCKIPASGTVRGTLLMQKYPASAMVNFVVDHEVEVILFSYLF